MHICSVILLVSLCSFGTLAQLAVGGIGDDISTALDSSMFDINVDESQLSFPVATLDPSCGIDLPARSWGAMIDSSADSINSYAEQVGATSANNAAMDGASMLSNFFNQSAQTAIFHKDNNGQSQTIILMGHADMCSMQTQKVSTSCSSSDQDPNNYCRTTTSAFEREFRRGLDQLVVLNNTKIIVFAPFRYSQICNFGGNGHTANGVFGVSQQCGDFWRNACNSNFQSGFGPCCSLTVDCSSDRVQDAYNTQLAYRAILTSVVQQYSGLPSGSQTPAASGNPGGAIIGTGVTFQFRDDFWNYQFQTEDISSCDCFHPSKLLQQKIANISVGSLVCSQDTMCCQADQPALCTGDVTISAGNSQQFSLFMLFCIFILFFVF